MISKVIIVDCKKVLVNVILLHNLIGYIVLTSYKNIIKSFFLNAGIIALGLSLGYGAMQGYLYATETKEVVVSDFSQHFENVEQSVIMYGVDWCPVCKTARAYFASHNIDYIELNPETDPHAFNMYKQLGVDGYPVFIIGNKRIYGLNLAEIENALKES